MTKLLSVHDLCVVYRVAGADLKALQDVTFDIEPGEIVGLVGESGSGKSTVAAALLRILAPNGRITGGSIEFAGDDLAQLSAERMRRARGADLSMIFQDPLGSLNPTATVGRQLMQVAASHPDRAPRSTAERRRRVIELFAEVGIADPEMRFDDYPHQFSGGMRQRVMIAMALLLQPKLIVADEATSALDVTLQAQVLDLFRQVRDRRGTSILLVSHDLGVVARTCDRVSVLYAGRVVETATSTELFEHPRHPYTRALIAAAPSYDERDRALRGIPGRVPGLHELPPGCAYADRCPDRLTECVERVPPRIVQGGHIVSCLLYDETAGTTSALVVPSLVTHVPEPKRRAEHDASREPLVTIRGLSKHYTERQRWRDRLRRVDAHAVRAVENVDLELRRGEIVGLVGESGSGKTTLALTLARLIEATSGEIDIDGIDVRRLRRRDLRRLRGRVQLILQDPVASLSPRMRVDRLLMEPYLINRWPVERRRSVPDLLELVGLSPDLATKYPRQLSGGQARRVSIARAIALQPELIVADEPTAGLDVSAAAGVLTLMDELRRQFGITYLVITHDLNVVAQFADRISVMYLGQVVESGTTQHIFEDPVHPYTQGLLAAVPRIGSDSAALDDELTPRGEMPSPRTPPPGCRYHTRCPLAVAACSASAPQVDTVEPLHTVACHRWVTARLMRPDPNPVPMWPKPTLIEQRGTIT